MKNALGLLAALVAMTLLGASAAAPVHPSAEASPPRGLIQYTTIRAEHANINGTVVETTLHIQNLSASTAVRLKELWVLGPAGVNNILGSRVYPGAGVTIPPLGMFDVPIDSSIQGVPLQTSVGGFGARSVVAMWDGPSDAARVTATIVLRGSSSVHRGHIEVEGRPVQY